MRNNKIGYLVRKAEKKDIGAVWEIRNNLLNRQNFNDQKEILFEQHKKWFKSKYFGGQDNKCFVLETKRRIIGYCRFDFENDTYLTSIAVNPEYSGRGLGSFLLSNSLKLLDSDQDVLAEIKMHNLVSLKLFENNNFYVYKKNKENYYLIFKKQKTPKL